MKKERCSNIFGIIGIVYTLVYVFATIGDVMNFKPYEVRFPFFLDNAVMYLLPGVLCFILRYMLRKLNRENVI